MANRVDVVIGYLLNQADYVKVDKIIDDCKISRRTFYNYLKDIKSDNQYNVESNDNGIKLTCKNTKLNRKRPEDYDGRKTFILRKGLIRGERLHVAYLLDYFAISDSTFHNDIIKLRREISKFHVRLISKDDELMFSGNYHDLKKLTQHIIYSESNSTQSLLSTSRLQEIFPNLDVEFVLSSIRNILSELNYFMDEYSIINLGLHILISLNQEVNGILPINNSDENKSSEVINRICDPIEKKYNFSFSKNAKNQFSMILTTRIKDNNQLNNDFTNIETIKLSSEIFDSLMSNYNLDMNDTSLKYSFMLHLDSLLTRIKNKVNLNNPLLSTIKQSSPITYDVAVTIAGIIRKHMHYTISESEIAYIALHIGTRIEELKSIRNKLNVIIVSPEYYNYNSGLKKIGQLYSEDLYISNVYTSFDNLSLLDDVDLIVCTISSYIQNSSIRQLRISNFLTSDDRNNISNIIQDIKKQKNMNRSKKTINSLFKRDLFFSHKHFDSKSEAIDFLSDNLYKNGYVLKDYKQSINKREEIAPTDFNMIAIPHPAEYSANETVISVCLLDEPLNWGRNDVSIIMMISVSNKDFETFDDIFTSITQLAMEPSKLKQLAKQDNYDGFIKAFLSMLYETI